jgi:hypothetical protein
VLQHFREEAINAANEEIQAAKRLETELDAIESDYAEMLASGSPFKAEIDGLRTKISENQALGTLTDALPGLKKRMFEAAKLKTVARSFKAIRSRLIFEVLADGILVACLFVLLRMWMGREIADDGFGAVVARVASIVNGDGDAKKYLFAVLGSLALVWIGLRYSSRRLAKRLFGK